MAAAVFEGLHFRSTDEIRQVLVRAARLKTLSEEDQTAAAAAQFAEKNDISPVSFSLLRAACEALRSREGAEKKGPWLHQILQGSEPVLPRPKERVKSTDLQARLAKLAAASEERSYKELVADVTREERAEAERQPFATYKDQLGLGLHVIFTMFTGYMFGWYLLKSQFQNDRTMQAMGGVFGLIAGMLLETVLFIIRASYAEAADKKRRT